MTEQEKHDSHAYGWLGIFAGFGVAAITQLVFKHPGLSMVMLFIAPLFLGVTGQVVVREWFNAG